jgi:hypothetical protein
LGIFFAPKSATAQLTSNELTVANAGLLDLIPANAVPQGGAYLSWQRPWQIVLPGNVFQPLGINLDIYDLGDGRVLLDDRLIDYDALDSLIHLSGSLSLSPSQNKNGPETDNGPSSPSYSYPEGALYLEIIGITNQIASLILHGTTATKIYELMSKTNLGDGLAWQPEKAVHGADGQTPITVPLLDRTDALYFWARVWDGIDENANSLPDWWEWEHFGNLAQIDSGDFDQDGATNLEEYNAGTDPNSVAFIVQFSNL